MIKVVLFDLDDTLISEYEYIKSGYRNIAQILNLKSDVSETELYYKLHSLFEESPRNVFNRICEEMEIQYDDSYIKYLVREYREHIPSINLYSDVKSFLNIIKEKNIKTGIITDGYSVSQHAKLKALNVEQLFEKIIVTDDLGREYWKPNPKAYEIMKDFFGVEYDEIIYIGDNPRKDFYISSIYPIRTVRIIREYGQYLDSEYYEDVKEEFRVCDLKEVLHILE